MTKRVRTILFFICLVFFLLAAPLIIFYSQGYRFDANPPAGGKRISQTGGLFIKAAPKQTKIYVDDKLKEETNFFFGSVLIDNLLPKKYKVRVEKEGYFAWEKNLEIKEREVAEAKNIVLLPENPNFVVLTKEVKNFWPSPDGRKIILHEDSENGWALKLYNLETNVKSHLIDETDVYQKGADFLKLEFSKDSKEIYLDAAVKEQEKNFVLKLEKFPPALEKREMPQISEDALTSQSLNGDRYFLDNSGYLFKNNEKLTEKPFPVKQETEYALEAFQNFIFLRESQTLYLFSPDSKSFEKFFDNIEDLKNSPDEKKLVYFSNSEIWIMFLKERYEQPPKKVGDKLFMLRLSERINNVLWLNSDYVIFNAGNKIKIAETDERDKINVVDVGEFKEPKIFWNESNKKLYILSGENLYVSENLIK